MSATCSIASAYSWFQAPALKNNGVSDNILTTTSERGNPWMTLLEEGRFGLASRPFITIGCVFIPSPRAIVFSTCF